MEKHSGVWILLVGFCGCGLLEASCKWRTVTYSPQEKAREEQEAYRASERAKEKAARAMLQSVKKAAIEAAVEAQKASAQAQDLARAMAAETKKIAETSLAEIKKTVKDSVVEAKEATRLAEIRAQQESEKALTVVKKVADETLAQVKKETSESLAEVKNKIEKTFEDMNKQGKPSVVPVQVDAEKPLAETQSVNGLVDFNKQQEPLLESESHKAVSSSEVPALEIENATDNKRDDKDVMAEQKS
jgi:hypothetical protein